MLSKLRRLKLYEKMDNFLYDDKQKARATHTHTHDNYDQIVWKGTRDMQLYPDSEAQARATVEWISHHSSPVANNSRQTLNWSQQPLCISKLLPLFRYSTSHELGWATTTEKNLIRFTMTYWHRNIANSKTDIHFSKVINFWNAPMVIPKKKTQTHTYYVGQTQLSPCCRFQWCPWRWHAILPWCEPHQFALKPVLNSAIIIVVVTLTFIETEEIHEKLHGVSIIL